MDKKIPVEKTFAALGLDERLLHAVAEKGYAEPSQIQAACIPHLLKGRDLLGTAQTGTGKTAAFALPILQMLLKHPRRASRGCMRALILTPTRELASQIHKSFLAYGMRTNASCGVIYGGVGMQPQIRIIQRGVDVLIATPGRLLDLKKQGHVRFDEVAVFVLDEADRMLDMGFQPDLKRIIADLPEVRQSVLFSATMPNAVKHLVDALLVNPVNIAVAPVSSTVDTVEQTLRYVDGADKKQLLLHVLDENPAGLTMVFMRMKHAANKIAEFLNKNGTAAEAIHGNKSQNARERALQAFREGKVRVLVATDVASRGIDIKGVELVINYDMPNEPEDYVHRIGRTARAGATGKAIAFAERDEHGIVRAIEKLINQKIPVVKDHPFAPEKPNGTDGKMAPAKNKFQRHRELMKELHKNSAKTVGFKFRNRRK